MASRNRVVSIEDDEKRVREENNSQEPHTVPNGLASRLPLRFSAVEFCDQASKPNLQLSQDPNALSQQNECECRPQMPSPNTFMKRRNSNLANREKMLQESNATSGDTCPITRNENSGPYKAILDCEVNEGYEGESGTKAQSVNGEEGSGHLKNNNTLNYSDGVKKQEEPIQALLHYFAKLSSSADVDDSLDLEHIQSLLRAGASVNAGDRFGQTLLHEVSRTWGTDVAQFFIDQGEAFNLLFRYNNQSPC